MTLRRPPQLQRRGLHVLLRGDKTRASRWIPWAKQKLHMLEKHNVGGWGKSFGQKARFPVERGLNRSVTVTFSVIKDQKWIIIEAESGPALYMESGVLDHRSTAPLNEATWLPSILHYNTDIESIRSPGAALGKLPVEELEPLKLNGENRGEGDSKAIGCSKSEKERELSVFVPTIFSGPKAATFTSEVPKFCDDLLLYKFYQVFRPPSMWSGKLRLMIQGIYGSKRRDYFLDVENLNFSDLHIDNGSFGWRLPNNTGLFSGRNYEYFKIILNPGEGVLAQRLEPTPAGKRLRKYLIDNPTIPADRKLRYETYLLSTLYFPDKKRTKIGEIGDLFIHGLPLGSYGAAWNWKGDTARVTTHTLKTGTTNVWQTTRHRISIGERDLAETLEEGRLAAATVVEEGPIDLTFRVNKDLIWSPDRENGGMKLFISQADAFDNPPHADTDAPIKDVYNYEKDDFDTVRYKRIDHGSGDTSFGGEFGPSLSLESDPEGNGPPPRRPRCSGDYACVVGTNSNGTVEVGFYVDQNTDFEGFGKTANHAEFESFECSAAAAGELRGTVEGFEFHSACDDSIENDEYQRRHSSAFGGYFDGNGSFDLESMLVFPWDDCDAIYLGRWHHFEGDISTGHTLDGAEVWTGVDLWNSGSKVATDTPRNWQWFPGTGTPKYALLTFARDQGEFIEVGVSSIEWDDIDIRHFSSGEFTVAYQQKRTSDASLDGVMFIPSCFTENVEALVVPDWKSEAINFGGWEFNPVVFPEPENALTVTARNTANHRSFRATAQPGGNGSVIEDGSYDFESNNIAPYPSPFQFSFVGFS